MITRRISWPADAILREGLGVAGSPASSMEGRAAAGPPSFPPFSPKPFAGETRLNWTSASRLWITASVLPRVGRSCRRASRAPVVRNYVRNIGVRTGMLNPSTRHCVYCIRSRRHADVVDVTSKWTDDAFSNGNDYGFELRMCAELSDDVLRVFAGGVE